ncbi:hypothetical protein KM043_016362 [Ampulex compressa]|nr:hypothetical protein KM043_016362 [Ampulex compressa]
MLPYTLFALLLKILRHPPKKVSRQNAHVGESWRRSIRVSPVPPPVHSQRRVIIVTRNSQSGFSFASSAGKLISTQIPPATDSPRAAYEWKNHDTRLPSSKGRRSIKDNARSPASHRSWSSSEFNRIRMSAKMR